jgi:hypothetical protein
MPGPAQPWDQPEDPRDQTVDMPRIDLAGFGNGRAAPEHGARSSWHLGDQSDRTQPGLKRPPDPQPPGPDRPPPAAPRPADLPSDRTAPGRLPRRDGGLQPGSAELPRQGLPPAAEALPPAAEPLPRRQPNASRDPYAGPDPYARPAGDGGQPGSLFRPAPSANGDRHPDRDGGRDRAPRDDGYPDIGSRDAGYRDAGNRDSGLGDDGYRRGGNREPGGRDGGYRGGGPHNGGPARGGLPRDSAPRDSAPRDSAPRDSRAQPTITSQLPAFGAAPGRPEPGAADSAANAYPRSGNPFTAGGPAGPSFPAGTMIPGSATPPAGLAEPAREVPLAGASPAPRAMPPDGPALPTGTGLPGGTMPAADQVPPAAAAPAGPGIGIGPRASADPAGLSGTAAPAASAPPASEPESLAWAGVASPAPGSLPPHPGASSGSDTPASSALGSPADVTARDPSSTPSLAPADPDANRGQASDGAGSSPPPRRRTGRTAPAGRPAAGSMGDLLARLDRLPDGHPSSPYEDGGLAKPPPHRLRQFELGLPAPEREPIDSGLRADFGSPAIGRPSPAPGDRLSPTTADGMHGPADAPGAAGAAEPARALGSETGVRPDRPADPSPAASFGSETGVRSDRPADPSPAASFGSETGVRSDRPADPGPAPALDGPDLGLRARPDARSQQDRGWPDQRPPPRQANGNGGPDHRPAADALSLGPWPGARPDEGQSAARRNGGDHPAPHAPAGRLGGDQADLVTGMLAAYRAAEGRNQRGEYGESGLTPAMRRIAAQLPRGGLAGAAEPLKSPDRFAAKLARLVTRHPGCSPEELAAGIGDGIRYAFTFDPDYYTEGTWLVHRKLKAYGFELEARRNRWDSPEYKGVWTRWRDPAHGLPFEIQFHTGVSWDVVQRTHEAFVRITDPATPNAERARLRARQVTAAAIAKAPPGYTEISDFGREAR